MTILLQAFDSSLNYCLGAQSLGDAQKTQTDKSIYLLFQVIGWPINDSNF